MRLPSPQQWRVRRRSYDFNAWSHKKKTEKLGAAARPFASAYFPFESIRPIWAHDSTEHRVNWRLQLDELQLRKILSLCEQFLLDAAVLIFVFPVLDTVVQFGKEQITGKLIAGTLAISGVFFIGALILGMRAAKGRE